MSQAHLAREGTTLTARVREAGRHCDELPRDDRWPLLAEQPQIVSSCATELGQLAWRERERRHSAERRA